MDLRSVEAGAALTNGDTNPAASTTTAPPKRSYDLSTLSIHADDPLNTPHGTDVAPPLHVSTTFRYTSDPSQLKTVSELVTKNQELPTEKRNDDESVSNGLVNSPIGHVYSRHTAPSSTRFETILESILHAPCATYSSGLAALHAFYVYFAPKRVAIGGGYHGSHGVLSIHARLTGCQILSLDECGKLEKGDVVHLETPVNPTGEALNIAAYAEKAHACGAILLVDSTFGPPGLQDPFKWGADVVMHSGTKYIGGHSDMLCGVLASNLPGVISKLREERTYLGSVMGSMEGWLGTRSLRTLELRVARQSQSAGKLVAWLDGLLKSKKSGDVGDGDGDVQAVVEKVCHASLQKEDMPWLEQQMPNGFGPVFAIVMKNEDLARVTPSKLELFHHATSLGGVESLVEWRAMSDPTSDRRLLRVSVGVEAWEDLRDDLLAAFKALKSELT